MIGLSLSILLGGMSGVTARAEENGTLAGTGAGCVPGLADIPDGVGVPEDFGEAWDECPFGSLGEEVYEYGEILAVSEKDEASEDIALSRKEQKAAEKAAKKAEKEAEKAAKEKKKEDKKDQKNQKDQK